MEDLPIGSEIVFMVVLNKKELLSSVIQWQRKWIFGKR